MANKLNQNEMSLKLNVSQPVYSRYENGDKEVDEKDEFVKQVAIEFDVTRKWLLNGDDITNNEESHNSATESYYNLPKDFMAAYFKQQQLMLEQILNTVAVKK
jgi:transcriptional regulator with XRE-family HTH domain